MISKILKTSGEKAPLKYVEQIEVEEFTMGMVPPRFHFCHARYNPTRNYLQLEADMGFRSSGFQLVVSLQQVKTTHAAWAQVWTYLIQDAFVPNVCQQHSFYAACRSYVGKFS